MNKIYILSGLGVDSRVFNKIDLTGCEVVHLEWITPEPSENMSSYAKRMSAKITDENPIIIGLSFGGMIAMEIAKIINVKKIILLASAKGHNELPPINRIVGHLKLHRLIPSSIFKQHNRVSNYFFGISSKEESNMLKQILQDTDPNFLRWAIDQIVCWRNDVVHPNVTHIHGNKDRIIPMRYVKPTYIIKNAGHFMTISHAKEIEIILNEVLG